MNDMTWKEYQKIDFSLSKIKRGSQEYQIMKEAAENGDQSAQHDMGLWHETVEHNKTEALKWYKRAANQGHEGAKEAYNDLINKAI